MKTRFAWASIRGGDPEPVEFVQRGKATEIVIFGDEETFWLDDEDNGVVIFANELVVPENLETQRQRVEREEKNR